MFNFRAFYIILTYYNLSKLYDTTKDMLLTNSSKNILLNIWVTHSSYPNMPLVYLWASFGAHT